MKIHKQGYSTLLFVFLFFIVINIPINFLTDNIYFTTSGIIVSLGFFLFVLRFFRSPKRIPIIQENAIISPADGQVVAIEETVENEYFKDTRILVSIFMSAWDIHINWIPVNGIVKYFKYHPGTFLLAKNPKSSTDNERTSIVTENTKGQEILFRQIAGIIARRVVTDIKKGDFVKQGNEFGFIKFGSRVDIFLPIDTEIKVKLGQKAVGTQTIIAEL